MLKRVTLLWIVGLATIVPYGIYHLLFTAQREEYAFLITIVLFWIFGFWGVVGPLLSAYKVRRLFKALEAAPTQEQLRQILQSSDAEDAAIDLFARDNHIPRFLAARLFRSAVRRLQAGAADSGTTAPQ